MPGVPSADPKAPVLTATGRVREVTLQDEPQDCLAPRDTEHDGSECRALMGVSSSEVGGKERQRWPCHSHAGEAGERGGGAQLHCPAAAAVLLHSARGSTGTFLAWLGVWHSGSDASWDSCVPAKMLLGMPSSHTAEPGFQSWLLPNSSFLPVHTFK